MKTILLLWLLATGMAVCRASLAGDPSTKPTASLDDPSSAAPATGPALEQEGPPKPPDDWKIMRSPQLTIAVPLDWQQVNTKGMGNAVLLLIGDGRGIPALDENSRPIHARFLLENLPKEKAAPKDAIIAMTRNIRTDPRFRVLTPPKIEEFTLADGTAAAYGELECSDDPNIAKLIQIVQAVDSKGLTWRAQTQISASADSKAARGDGYLGRWLRAHLRTMVFNGDKFSEDPLKPAYKDYAVEFKKIFGE